MPNIFAYTALLLWPFISILFYKRLPVLNATFWTIFGGFLFLPVKTAIDLPFIPELDKESIPIISALIGCVFIKKIKINLIPKRGVEKWLVIILLVSPFITTLNNQEVIRGIPALTLHDSVSAILLLYIFILPFILGMQLIKTYDDQIILFKLIVISGLFYSLLILLEVRMSPQLHTWIYGFFPHDFHQQVRFGGFRSVVFLGHGLMVAMFVAITIGAATILLKEKIRIQRRSPWVIIIYLFIILFLCKTVGAFILGTLLFIVITWMPGYIVKRLALFIIFVVILYPLLSIFDLFPHDQLIQIAHDFDQEKADSLAFRFYHEKLLLEHAQQKLYFGWGGWNRNRLEGSVTDGYWIIILGQYGLFGFVSVFGLAVLSVWRATNIRTSLADKKNKVILNSHALIVAVIMIDQILNASLSAWLLFIIGALLGHANSLRVKKENSNQHQKVFNN